MIRLKLECLSVTKAKHWDENDKRYLFTPRMKPVKIDSEESKTYFTTSGYSDIAIGSFTEDIFEPGKEYYVDITPAE